MPRISETLVLGTTNYKPTRPQNGDTPATFREVSTGKPLVELNLVNMVTSQSQLQGVTVYHGKVNLIVPKPLTAEGKQEPANRYEIKTRVGSSLTAAKATEERAALVALIESDEFLALLQGDAQF